MENILVDPQDQYLLTSYTWHLKDGVYPVTTIGRKNLYLHQLILPNVDLVDHINRNPLDNRRENLRASTKSLNAMNSKLRVDNTSGVKGVSWNVEKNRWEVYINFERRRIRLGRYRTLAAAIAKRLEAEDHYHGEHANQELKEIMKQKIQEHA